MDLRVWDGADVFTELGDAWRELFDACPEAPIFLSWEWLSTWWRHFHDGRAPNVVTLADNGQIFAIAALMRDEARGRLAFMARGETTDYADILTAPSHQEAAAAQLLDHLSVQREQGVSTCLEPVAEDSALLGLSRARADQFTADAIEPCPLVTLPGSWEDYLAQLSKKDRHELRRKLRRAETAGDLTHQVATRPDELPPALQNFYRLHQSSSDPRKAQFLEPHLQTFFSDVAHALAQRGWLRLATLKLDGAAIASVLAFARGSTVALYNSGLDPDYRWLSPGIAIIAYELQAAIAAGCTTYDFLRGDEPYKYDFGAHDRFVWSLKLESPVPSPLVGKGQAPGTSP